MARLLLALSLVGIALQPVAKAAARGAGQAPVSREITLRTLREGGRARLEAGNPDAALAAANEILRLAPDDPEGLRLRADASQAILAKPKPPVTKAERRQRNEGFLVSLEREMRRPQPGVVLSAGGLKRGPREPLVVLEPWERALRRKLREPVSVAFRNTPAAEALAQLSALGGVSIVLDPDAAAEAREVTFTRKGMPLEVALRWVGRFAGLDYALRDGAVYFAAPATLRREPVRRTYSITGLLAAPRDARRRRESGPVELGEPSWERPPPEESPDRIGEGWAQFIRATIASDTWPRPGKPQVAQEASKYSIGYRNGRLVVVHSREVHKQIADLLSSFRQRLNLQVYIHCRFLFVAHAEMEALNLDTAFDSLDEQPDHHGRVQASIVNDPEHGNLTRFSVYQADSGGLDLTYSYLGDDQVSALLAATRKSRKAVLLNSARIVCANTQRAVIQRVLSINYIRRLSSDDEPEIGNIPEGFILDVQPFVSADQRYITIVLQPQMRTLMQLNSYDYASDPEEFVIGPDGEPLLQGRAVQLPITQLQSLGTTVTVPNGGTMLVGGLTEGEERSATAGVPFIEHLPLLSRIFRGTDRRGGKRCFIILVTAETVPDIFAED